MVLAAILPLPESVAFFEQEVAISKTEAAEKKKFFIFIEINLDLKINLLQDGEQKIKQFSKSLSNLLH